MSRWFPTHGVKPNTSAEKVWVKYRCGLPSKQAYPVASQRWNWTGDDWDILEYRAEIEEPREEAA